MLKKISGVPYAPLELQLYSPLPLPPIAKVICFSGFSFVFFCEFAFNAWNTIQGLLNVFEICVLLPIIQAPRISKDSFLFSLKVWRHSGTRQWNNLNLRLRSLGSKKRNQPWACAVIRGRSHCSPQLFSGYVTRKHNIVDIIDEKIPQTQTFSQKDLRTPTSIEMLSIIP